MNVKRIVVSISVLLFASWMVHSIALSDLTYAAGKVVHRWKCQSHWPVASPSYQGSMLKIINLIKEKTDGQLVIEPYAAGSLLPAKEIYHGVKRGMIEMGGTATSYFREQIPVGGVSAGLPYSFKEVWEAVYFFKHYGYEKMIQEACLKEGIIFYTDKVYPHEPGIKRPIRTMEDFKGLKMRSSGVIQLFLTKLGAAASYLPGPELYPALASGVVDGAHWGAAQGADKMGIYDICKYHMKPALAISGTDVWLINEKAFNKLPPDIQAVVRDVLELHFWQRSNEYIYLEAKTLARVQKEKGVEVVTIAPEDQKMMTQVAQEVWDEEAKKNPEYAKAIEMMKEFLRELGHIE
jgi:TRAP-type mannitol/chloroaromatic compound transport system substrate-binding protein